VLNRLLTSRAGQRHRSRAVDALSKNSCGYYSAPMLRSMHVCFVPPSTRRSVYSPTETSVLVKKYTPVLKWHWSTDRMTDLSHAAGTGLRTHVDAIKVPLGVVVSPSSSVLLFSPCFSARLSARAVLWFSPCCCVSALCSIGRGARAPLECTSSGWHGVHERS
jgi:hypothetical protein